MKPEVIAAIIGAVVGAVFAYGGGWLQTMSDRKRRRQSLATVLLAEVRSADVTLRGFCENPSVGVLGTEAFRSFTLLSEALESLLPRTVSTLLDFRSYVDNIREYQGMMVAGKIQKSALDNSVLRALAAAGISRVGTLKTALEQEGVIYRHTPVLIYPKGFNQVYRAFRHYPQARSET